MALTRLPLATERRIGSLPADGGAVALEVDDFDAAISRLKQSGALFRSEPFDTPVCRMAVISDPDGNSIILHKRKAR